MNPRLLTLAGIAMLTFVLACGGSGGSDEPVDVVEEFYQRMEQADEPGMAELVCPESRDDVASMPGLGRIFGSVFILEAPDGSLPFGDYEAVLVESDESSAIVGVSGAQLKILAVAGFPLDEDLELRRTDEGQWCIVDYAPEADDEPPFPDAVLAEADSDPTLPGEYVDLPAIYDGFYGNPDGNNTNAHVNLPVDYESEQGLPPTGGHHWGSTGCGSDPTVAPQRCGPAPWGIFTDPWDAATLVHNMEHAGVVVWYNTTDQAVIDDLTGLVLEELNRRLIVMSPYPDMEEGFVAITSWSRRLLVPDGDYDRDLFAEFIEVHERRFNPENF
ncbi:MAG: DUF3105 domain-containing protein [Chloroflexi bacterium]|nr:DUF3105 domain-containing protein [Chloroflexota bacterium]